MPPPHPGLEGARLWGKQTGVGGGSVPGVAGQVERPRGERWRVWLESLCPFLGPKSSRQGGPARHPGRERRLPPAEAGEKRAADRAGEAETESGSPAGAQARSAPPSPRAAAWPRGRLEPRSGLSRSPRAQRFARFHFILLVFLSDWLSVSSASCGVQMQGRPGFSCESLCVHRS